MRMTQKTLAKNNYSFQTWTSNLKCTKITINYRLCNQRNFLILNDLTITKIKFKLYIDQEDIVIKLFLK